MADERDDFAPGYRPLADTISTLQIVEAQSMSDEFTPEPAVEPTDLTDPVEPTTESSFIVIHHNEHGHPFATRVSATSAEDAQDQVLSAHTDNDIVETIPDDGRATHGLGGDELPVVDLPVVDLNDEP